MFKACICQACYLLIHLFLTATIRTRTYFHLHLTDEELSGEVSSTGVTGLLEGRGRLTLSPAS